jgi:hypothetical protein
MLAVAVARCGSEQEEPAGLAAAVMAVVLVAAQQQEQQIPAAGVVAEAMEAWDLLVVLVLLSYLFQQQVIQLQQLVLLRQVAATKL